jgi:hypothetical protein
MTITRRPPRNAKPAPRRLKTPESFIESAAHPLTAEALLDDAAKPAKKKSKMKAKGKDGKVKLGKTEKKRKDKEAVLIRFEDEQLSRMDARAASLGLSRAAWLRMLVAKTLMDKND